MEMIMEAAMILNRAKELCAWNEPRAAPTKGWHITGDICETKWHLQEGQVQNDARGASSSRCGAWTVDTQG